MEASASVSRRLKLITIFLELFFCCSCVNVNLNTQQTTKFHVVRRGEDFHVRADNDISLVYNAYDIRAFLYKGRCRGLPILQIVNVAEFDSTIECGEATFETMICGGQCSSSSFPQFSSDHKQIIRTTSKCVACGPAKEDKKTVKKIVRCKRKDKGDYVERIVHMAVVNNCKCRKFQCEPLKGLLK